MLVSVIVPVYNVECYLRECLDSLLGQTFRDFEVVLVNDGSTDGSLRICEEYCERAPDVFRLFSQKNGGLSSARNTGLERALGEYVCFVDSDDWVSSDFLAVLHEAALAVAADIVVCGYTAHHADGHLEILPGTDSRAPELRRQVLLGPTFACNKMFRRELFDGPSGRFLEGVCYEDLGTIPLLVARARQLAVCEAPVYHYRIGRPGAITTFRDERILHIFITLGRLRKMLPETFFPELEWMAVKACVFRYALVARHPRGAEFQGRLRDFLKENFPDWPANEYLRRERGRNFRAKAFLMRWNLGGLLRIGARKRP
ncbi:MAG: glycosyltransferase [Puniceicoccales bacterium]|nr:glycosyltransferase [Puniceicoccales bacterium]